MGWSTELFCNISFNKETYNTIYKVEEDLEESERLIKYYINRLRELALITEPSKMFNCKDCGGYDLDPVDIISTKFDEYINELNGEYYKCFKLRYLKENWDKCHNEDGNAITPPDNIHYDSAFIDGDFIK